MYVYINYNVHLHVYTQGQAYVYVSAYTLVHMHTHCKIPALPTCICNGLWDETVSASIIYSCLWLPSRQTESPRKLTRLGDYAQPLQVSKYPLAVRTMVVHIIHIHWGHMRRRCTGAYGPFPPSSYGLTLTQLSTIKLWIIHKRLHTGMHLDPYNQHTTPCMKAVRVQINQC